MEVRGIALPPHYGGLSLQLLVAGEALPPLRLTAPALADLPNGPGSTLGCLRLALLLVTDQAGRYVVMIKGPSEHEPAMQDEVAGQTEWEELLYKVASGPPIYSPLKLLDPVANGHAGRIAAGAHWPGAARRDRRSCWSPASRGWC